jgi:hypothetical protein
MGPLLLVLLGVATSSPASATLVVAAVATSASRALNIAIGSVFDRSGTIAASIRIRVTVGIVPVTMPQAAPRLCLLGIEHAGVKHFDRLKARLPSHTWVRSWRIRLLLWHLLWHLLWPDDVWLVVLRMHYLWLHRLPIGRWRRWWNSCMLLAVSLSSWAMGRWRRRRRSAGVTLMVTLHLRPTLWLALLNILGTGLALLLTVLAGLLTVSRTMLLRMNLTLGLALLLGSVLLLLHIAGLRLSTTWKLRIILWVLRSTRPHCTM